MIKYDKINFADWEAVQMAPFVFNFDLFTGLMLDHSMKCIARTKHDVYRTVDWQNSCGISA